MKIKRINEMLSRKSISPIDISINDEDSSCENERLKFIQYIWNRVGVDNWEMIQKRRMERKLYISSLSEKISEIANSNYAFQNLECEELIRKRISQNVFIEDSTILEPIRVDHLYFRDSIKWFSVGMNVGKSSLLVALHNLNVADYPLEFVPRALTGYASNVKVKCINKKGEERNVDYTVGFWDTVGDEEYDRLRPLSYPDTTIYTMNYAVNDWKSLVRISDLFIWECTSLSPNATFVVVSTKNDLEEECYWNSLFDSTRMEEPISSQDGRDFTKAIGAISFIETSSKTLKGIKGLDRKLVLLRLAHQKYLKSLEKRKKCSLQ